LGVAVAAIECDRRDLLVERDHGRAFITTQALDDLVMESLEIVQETGEIIRAKPEKSDFGVNFGFHILLLLKKM
jgi:hypothetical protein